MSEKADLDCIEFIDKRIEKYFLSEEYFKKSTTCLVVQGEKSIVVELFIFQLRL